MRLVSAASLSQTMWVSLVMGKSVPSPIRMPATWVLLPRPQQLGHATSGEDRRQGALLFLLQLQIQQLRLHRHQLRKNKIEQEEHFTATFTQT